MIIVLLIIAYILGSAGYIVQKSKSNFSFSSVIRAIKIAVALTLLIPARKVLDRSWSLTLANVEVDSAIKSLVKEANKRVN